MASNIIGQYLASPPYLGRSAYADRTYVRQTCGATCCFDEPKKMWGTRQIDCLITLVRSRKFQPFGIERDWNHELVDAAQAYAAEAEAKWREQNAAPKPAQDAPRRKPQRPELRPDDGEVGWGIATNGDSQQVKQRALEQDALRAKLPRARAASTTGARKEAKPVCKAAKKLIAKPNPKNQGKLAFKPATKDQTV